MAIGKGSHRTTLECTKRPVKWDRRYNLDPVYAHSGEVSIRLHALLTGLQTHKSTRVLISSLIRVAGHFNCVPKEEHLAAGIDMNDSSNIPRLAKSNNRHRRTHTREKLGISKYSNLDGPRPGYDFSLFASSRCKTHGTVSHFTWPRHVRGSGVPL